MDKERRSFLIRIAKVVGASAVTVATAGCGGDADKVLKATAAVLTNIPQPPEKIATATNVPPTATKVESTATPKVEPTAYHVEAAGGAYTEAQLAINDSQQAKDQQTKTQRWLDYWINFENRPFAPDTSEIHWKYTYDDPLNPKEVLVLIEAGGEYGGKLFAPPLGGGKFADFPPAVSGNNIETNFGPLQLTAGAEGQWLSVENGIPVRRDGAGKIVEKLNMVKGQWEVASLIKGDIFFDPQSKEDFSKVVEAPSPIDNPAEFAIWQEEYLKQVNEKLKTYTGTAIDYKTRGFEYGTGKLILGGTDVNVISSYKLNGDLG
jgi:hypothetical protein